MKHEPTIKDIFEIIVFIRDNAVMKHDLENGLQKLRVELKADIQDVRNEIQELRTELKAEIKDVYLELKSDIRDLRIELKTDIKNLQNEIRDVRNEMIEHVDGFIGLYKKHDSELAAVITQQNRIRKKLKLKST